MKRILFLLLSFISCISFAQTSQSDALIRKAITPQTFNGLVKQGTIAQLRAMSPNANDFSTTYFCTETGKEGTFKADFNDNTTSDNGATCLISGGVRIKRILDNNFVDPRWFGLVSSTTIDNSTALQNAIDYAISSKVNRVLIPAGEYKCQNVVIKSNVVLEGTSINGKTTILGRYNSSPILVASGVSVLSANPSAIKDFAIRNIQFKTYDIVTTNPALLLKVAYTFRLENCFFVGNGLQVLFWEAFDSVIERCRFDWGGFANNASSTSVEIASTNRGITGGESIEYSNNLYFNDCVFESYLSTAIKTTGSNSSKIFFKNLKMESANNVTSPHIFLQYCSNINLGSLVIGSRILPVSPIQFSNIFNVYGRMSYEFFPDQSGVCNKEIATFQDIRNADFKLLVIDFPATVNYTAASLANISYVNYNQSTFRGTNNIIVESPMSSNYVRINIPTMYRRYDVPISYYNGSNSVEMTDNAAEIYFNGTSSKTLTIPQSSFSIRSSLGLKFGVMNGANTLYSTKIFDTSGYLSVDLSGVHPYTPSAALAIFGTNKGFLPPVNTSYTNIGSPVEGLVFYNSTDKNLNVFDGSGWLNVGTPNLPYKYTNGTNVFQLVSTGNELYMNGADTDKFITTTSSALTIRAKKGLILTGFDGTTIKNSLKMIDDGSIVIDRTGAYPWNASRVFAVKSTTQGSSPYPVMTQSQRDAITSKESFIGVICSDCIATDTSTGVLQIWNGTSWKNAW